MTQKAAIVTGASSGIGLAITEMLCEEGYAVTMAARRPDKLAAAAQQLKDAGMDVFDVAASVAEEEDIKRVIAAHTERFGRLDVLVNNAGVGLGAPIEGYPTKHLDMQFDVNLRSIVIFYRECLELLKAAVADQGQANVINTASIAGKQGQPWLSVYSATKAGIIGFTEAMNRELAGGGIKSCALCPAFVDTPMTDFAKATVAAEDMIRTSDVAELVRGVLKLSPACIVPEIQFVRPGDGL